MNKKISIIISIVLILAIVACVTLTSLAWYSTHFVGSQSLDFAVFSKSIITLEMSDSDFYADFLPARAYRGAVAAGMDVSDIFADPFYYSTDGVSFVPATSAQLASRLALRYYDSTQSLEKNKYPLATNAQLAEATNIYYFTGLEYVPATSAQIAEGQCIYVPIGNGYTQANYSDLNDSYIENKAQIGVAKVLFDYYGSSDEQGLFRLSCQVLSKWPNAPADSDFNTAEGEEEDPVDRSTWRKDIGDEVSYIVCVSGVDFVIDDDLRLKELPNTTILIKNEAGTYEDFSLGNYNDMYLFDSNTSHAFLLDYFGIDNYYSEVGYVNVSPLGNNYTYDAYFDSSWSEKNVNLANEDNEGIGTFHYAMYQAINTCIATNAPAEFRYNSIGYAVQKDENSSIRFNVSEMTNGLGQLVTKTTMNLQFYIFLWYNQVDEFLSPNVTFGDIGLAITVRTGD